MEETCSYCGEEILGEGVRYNEQAYCCQECVDAANEDAFDFLDTAEYEEF